PELVGALARAAAASAPYRLRLRGAGVFSHRTLWVGVGGDTAAQQALAHAAVAAGEAAQTQRDDRPRERAHLTIRGVRGGGGRRGGRPWGAPSRRGVVGRPEDDGLAFDPEAVVGALAVYEGPEWAVDELLLVGSRPGEGRGGGPLYAIVDSFGLTGA